MKEQTERYKFRIDLLKEVAKLSDYNPEKMVYPNDIYDSLEIRNKEDLISNAIYLSQKFYLEILPLRDTFGVSDIGWIKITSNGIDFVEKLNDGRNLDDYFDDFPKSYLINIQQGDKSQISLFSKNVNQSIIEKDEFRIELLRILNEIEKKDKDNEATKKIIDSIKIEIEKKDKNWEKVSGMIQILLSLSSIATQILSPEIRSNLGL